MSKALQNVWTDLGAERQADFIASANGHLSGLSARERVAWAMDQLPGKHMLSSSFGVQAAVMLHLVTSVAPRIPVVFVDTGYLFPETYRFVDELTERLDLNLHVYRSPLSSAWLEARHGKLWESGLDGIEHYNRLNKVEPMRQALKELEVGSWFAGLRRDQSNSRREVPVLASKDGRFKIHPIVDWRDRDVYRYLKRHDLPYHPLWEQGYVSVGDVHTTRRLEPGMLAEETRFFGLKRECGLHE
ncbi:phosphoadenylyl-sulfate reductase [Thiocystis violascens]|uniref:Phosphoadenosine 5'-phosphosulfate reductase n=1 Tax=Thiocystis violascens (strain ATCC 17096 / DSM 198 / 6111) TaxID=765911 RepID=I3Y8U7_THIV6|nr:phosphoadenylyl-sulfate reductase [Thiocystis violascens]AFL73415.1 phosphoadenosine phosphosulfate reductase, thioredoxin dependent [Thiocystis violascens DSM 198]